jgi:hypothetical protein
MVGGGFGLLDVDMTGPSVVFYLLVLKLVEGYDSNDPGKSTEGI